MTQFDFSVLAVTQELNRRTIDEVNFFEIKDGLVRLAPNELTELFEVVNPNSADQTQDRLRTFRPCFNSKHRGTAIGQSGYAI